MRAMSAAIARHVSISLEAQPREISIFVDKSRGLGELCGDFSLPWTSRHNACVRGEPRSGVESGRTNPLPKEATFDASERRFGSSAVRTVRFPDAERGLRRPLINGFISIANTLVHTLLN